MGQLTILNALLREYVIFFGSPIGSGGHAGRYSFVKDYTIVLSGEWRYCGDGDTHSEE